LASFRTSISMFFGSCWIWAWSSPRLIVPSPWLKIAADAPVGAFPVAKASPIESNSSSVLATWKGKFRRDLSQSANYRPWRFSSLSHRSLRFRHPRSSVDLDRDDLRTSSIIVDVLPCYGKHRSGVLNLSQEDSRCSSYQR